MKNKKEIHGIIVIGISVMIVYFFTWKNFQEYRGKYNQKQEFLQKLMLQEKHYQELKRQLNIMKMSFSPKIAEGENREMFSHLLEFELLLQRVLEKHHLQLQGLGRIQKEGNRLFISSKIQGKIYNLLMLIQELEQDSRRVSFSEEYWKLERSHNQTAILDCNFVIYVKEGEYDFEVITRNNKKNRVPFVHLAKRHSISFYILFALICLFTLEEVCYAKELPKDIEMSDTTLREALDELEGCLGIKITVDESPKDPLNLFFQEGQSIEEVLDMLGEITNKKVKKISNHEFLLEEVQIQKEEISKEYHLHYLRSKEIYDALKDLFPDIKIANLDSRNQVIVVAEEKKIHEIDKLMEHMDIEGKQVKVHSQILDISKDLFHELGFDWLYEKPSQQKNKFSVAVLGEESVGNSGPVLGSKWNLIRQFSNATEALGLSLKLLEARQDLKITSSPSILIAHGNKGEFKITEEVIVGEKKEKKKGESTSVEPIFKEAGLILKVIPYIHQDNSVTLDISLELSDFRYRQTNQKKDWNFNAQGGSKMGRSLSTRIHVKNKETILIGGLSRSTHRNTENRVPFLSDIPGLGYLFKSESKKDAETDMYIKIFIEVCE